VHLKSLQIFNFKNHAEQRFEFCSQINCITGKNGVGKTNLLDAVYYLANAKSFFNGIDAQIIRHGSEFFSLHGWFEMQEQEGEFDILVTFTDKGKKTMKKNGKTYARLLDHIGFIQTVFITPYDISLVLEGSEERRRFVDFTLCQTDREYLEVLAYYKKIQDQRNAFLKKMDGRIADPDILESYDARLIPAAEKIHKKRTSFINTFLPYFKEYYNFISDDQDSCALNYISELQENNFADLLMKYRERDRVLMRTGSGIHKDEFEFLLNGFPLKKYGSQGQIKSFVIALKLAQYRFFQDKTRHKAILLLDDIYEKIDATRAAKLMQLVASDFFGQIIITDTHEDRVKQHLDTVIAEKKYFSI
jgi:DNA replication and repair protein RecF